MIETKEQYEWAKKADAILLQGTDVETIKSSDLIELIEALRDVARAAEEELALLATDGMRNKLLEEALDALPDWLTESPD